MKKYVFINYAICAIGGAQIYIYNKSRYCEQNDWKVYIFSGCEGKIYIERFKEFSNLINTILNISPYLCTKRKIRKTICWMLKCIDYYDGDEVLIESGTGVAALWGELLAKACNGKNIANILDEKIKLKNQSVHSFFEFKYERKEFRCIKKRIMQSFFEDKQLTEEQCYAFRAPCTNSMENIDVSIKLDLVPDRPVIGVVGRIGKGYVHNSVNEIIKFARKHPEEFYNILIVGGGDNIYHKRLHKLCDDVKNIKLIITGRLYPIPQKIIEKMNIAIGGSGSIRLPWSLDIPSISVEFNSNKALGFVGYDTQNTQLALDGEKLRDISECLEDFFFNSYIDRFKGVYVSTNLVDEDEIKEVLDTHFEYIKLSNPKKEYFDKFKPEGVKEVFKKFINSLPCGYRLLKLLTNFNMIYKKL